MYGTKQVVWKKQNGDIITRTVGYGNYRVGDTNSYNWIIIDIKYLYGKKFYSYDDYKKKTRRHELIRLNFRKLKKQLFVIYKWLCYILILLILFRANGITLY